MQWTGLNELREKYLSFFESKGHLRLPSFSLVPNNDNSLLLINSGMAPMKKFFTGEVTPPRTRVTTCQKCIRTGDIENIGITDRHGTFFEMLGNFSFGDYFKNEAVPWAWEFCTKVLQMPQDKLWVTIYLDDEETYDIWTKKVGVDPSHIVRLGKEDNFWEHGSGPCGPCSEIYFDRGEKHGCGKPTCGPGCDCDRYVEFWNVVFSQFDSDGKGNYPPMEHPNIDTGMGLERLACIMQGVDNLFLVDTVQNIMKKVSEIAGVAYGQDKKTDMSLRVITDHVRSCTFMLGDGVMPSNEGRGYVLRRLLRRAARHGRLLGVHQPFLYKVVDTVIAESHTAYPELQDKAQLIGRIVKMEEESFARTIDQGLALLGDFIEKAQSTCLSGDEAFRLNDTYGFPLDLTKEILAEKGMTVDEARFAALLQEQKERARAARKNAGADAWAGDTACLAQLPATKFTGYTQLSGQAQVLAVVCDGERTEKAEAGEEALLVLDCTPFYAESGGQVSDIGEIVSDGCEVQVDGVTKTPNGFFLHRVQVLAGSVCQGDTVMANVNVPRRKAIMRNHTAAHLLQAALRKVLGSHVEQAGQLVNEEHVRFDFTHFSALSADELRQVEQLVNDEILNANPVSSEEMDIEQAKKLGAMMLFGEKYGSRVRVVSDGSFSKEFCGGTHVDNTAKIGLFKIVAESSVAAGVRRIEAVTGGGVLQALRTSEQLVKDCAAALKLNNSAELPEKLSQLTAQLKAREKEIESMNAKAAASGVKALLENACPVGAVRVAAQTVKGADSTALRTMCDTAKDMAPDIVLVLAGENDGKVTFAAAAGEAARKAGVHAGKLVKAVAAVTGGNGGGKPDFAMAGAKDAAKVNAALQSANEAVRQMLG